MLTGLAEIFRRKVPDSVVTFLFMDGLILISSVRLFRSGGEPGTIWRLRFWSGFLIDWEGFLGRGLNGFDWFDCPVMARWLMTFM